MEGKRCNYEKLAACQDGFFSKPPKSNTNTLIFLDPKNDPQISGAAERIRLAMQDPAVHGIHLNPELVS